MIHLILLALTWFTVGSLSTIIYLRVIPNIKRQRFAQKQRQEHINKQPRAYHLHKPIIHNN